MENLEINMHHLQGNAIPAGSLSDFGENLFCWWIPEFVHFLKENFNILGIEMWG